MNLYKNRRIVFYSIFLILFLLANGQDQPVISVTPESINDDLLTGETSVHTLTIDNTAGSSALEWSIMVSQGSSASVERSFTYTKGVNGDRHNSGFSRLSPMSLNESRQMNGSIKILAWTTYADFASEYPNTLSAIAQYTDYTLTETTETDPVILEDLLNNSDVFLIPDQEGGTTAEFQGLSTSWFSVLENFVSSGGKIVMCGSFSDATEILNFNGLMGIDLAGSMASGELAVEDPDHFLIENTTPPINGQNLTALVTISDESEAVLVSNGLAAVAVKSIGAGHIAYVGWDFFDFDDNAARVISNAVTGPAQNWLSVSSSSGNLAAGSFTTVNVNLDADGLSGGVYENTLLVESNDPTNGVISVPVTLNVTSAPDIEISDDVIDFGTNFVGTTTVREITISNSGAEELTASINVDNSDYTLSSESLLLAPSESEVLTVTYQPSAEETDNGSITISSNDIDEPEVSIALMGMGQDPPMISVTPGEITDDLFSGQTSMHTLTIDNSSGGSDLAWELEIEYGSATTQRTFDFESYRNRLIDTSMSGHYDNFKKESKTVKSNSSQPSPGRYAYTGGEVLYGVNNTSDLIEELDPVTGAVIRSIAAPQTPDGTDGLAFDGEFLYFTNDGGEFYKLDPSTGEIIDTKTIAIVSDAVAFSGTHLYSLDYNASTILKIDFESGNIVGSLNVTSNNLVGGMSFGGSRGTLFVSAASENLIVEIDFDSQEIVNSFSANPNIYGVAYSESLGLVFCSNATSNTISAYDPDTGNLEYTFSTGSHWALAADEARGDVIPDWISSTKVSGTVNAGSSETVDLTMNAADLITGTYEANLKINSNDPNSLLITIPVTLNVTGTPDIDYTNGAIDFGEIYIGTSDTREVTISNIGTGSLNGSLSVDNPHFSLNTENVTIEPSGSMVFEVTYEPSAIETNSGNITITSNDPDEPSLTIAILGSGSALPEIEVSRTEVGRDLLIGHSADENFQITNVSSSAINITVGIESDGDWLGAPFDGALEAGSSEEITVSMNAEQLDVGVYTGKILIYSEDNLQHFFEILVTLNVQSEGRLEFLETIYNVDAEEHSKIVGVNTNLSSFSAQPDESWVSSQVISSSEVEIIINSNPSFSSRESMVILSGNDLMAVLSVNQLGTVPLSVVDDDLSIYPNPAKRNLHVEGVIEDVILMSLDGKRLIVPHYQKADNIRVLNVAALPAGMYLVEIKFIDGESLIRRVIRQ